MNSAIPPWARSVAKALLAVLIIGYVAANGGQLGWVSADWVRTHGDCGAKRWGEIATASSACAAAIALTLSMTLW